MPPRVLLTGFEPFGPHAVNPSELVLRPLSARPPGGAVVSTRVLRVSYRDAFAPVREALEDERFDAVVLMGVAARRGALSFERVAVNRRGGAQTDNDGVLLAESRIDPAGPAACFSTLPMAALAESARAAGAPAELSDDAGTFLCNQVLYETLRHCDRRELRTRVGFVHLPMLPDAAAPGEPSLDERTLLLGLAAVLAYVVALPPPGPALEPRDS